MGQHPGLVAVVAGEMGNYHDSDTATTSSSPHAGTGSVQASSRLTRPRRTCRSTRTSPRRLEHHQALSHERHQRAVRDELHKGAQAAKPKLLKDIRALKLTTTEEHMNNDAAENSINDKNDTTAATNQSDCDKNNQKSARRQGRKSNHRGDVVAEASQSERTPGQPADSAWGLEQREVTTNTHDSGKWSLHVKELFEQEWKCDDTNRRGVFECMDKETKHKSWHISEHHIDLARRCLRRKSRRDHTGLTTPAWLSMPDHTLVSIVQRWATEEWGGTSPRELRAYVAGKGSDNPKLNDIRMIVPQPALLSVIDIIIATNIDDITWRTLPDPPGVFTAAKPGTKFSTSHVASRCSSREEQTAQGGITVADINQFYDNIDVSLAVSTAGIGHCIVALAIVRHQMWTRVGVKCGAATVEIGPRGWGT